MTIKKSQVIGIVGGMGPKAGVALYDRLVNLTQAKIDQDHPSVILMAFPQEIVDRTQFLEGKIATNPGHNIAKIIEKLAISGAQIIGIACNTSHSPAIFNVIESQIKRLKPQPNLIHMPQEVCNYISNNYSDVLRVGIMATNGTYKSGLYQKILHNRGYDVVIPDPIFQNEVIHRMIYDSDIGIKANPNTITKEAGCLWRESISFFRTNGCEAIILACTELSLMLNAYEEEGIYVIDSIDCLAKGLLREIRER